MTIQKYFNKIKGCLDRYVKSFHIIDIEVNFDYRTHQQGFVSGVVYFANNTRLHFKEYVDASEEIFQKLRYSYHFQDADHSLIFRYDNAAHKPKMSFKEHKHLANEIVEAPSPTLSEVILEILAHISEK